MNAKIKKKNSRRGGNEYIFLVLLVVVAVAVVLGMVLFGGGKSSDDSERESVGESASADGDINTEAKDTADIGGNGSSGVSSSADTESTGADTVAKTETIETEPPVQTIPVGIYKKNGKVCRLITEYQSEWPENDSDPLWKLDTWTASKAHLICDVAYFAVFTSFEEEIDFTYWDETWVERWEAEGLDDSYKIGFEFTAYLENGRTESATVLGPEDTFALENYFELYLYDCVAHAHDSWYSHITESTNYDDTKNVMVKVTLRDGCYDVAFIEMTAFVYKDAVEFDSDGKYIGANKATLIIEREE